jgi:PD-(D/E)XK nuclease superfamily protein
MLRNVAILGLRAMERAPDFLAWSADDGAALRREAARLLKRQDHAAAFLRLDAMCLAAGIELVPFVGPGAPFGPAWPGHPFLSPAMRVGYKLREADLTRELARLMGPERGSRGPQRARSFLRALAEVAGRPALTDTLTDTVRPSVTAEHLVSVRWRRPTLGGGPAPDVSGPPTSKQGSSPRIDLLFEWSVGSGSSQAVVVVEAKLGATVADGQLKPYRKEAERRAKGGPVTLILLTAHADKAERRHRAWSAVRWLALMRRWEPLMAADGDDDPEFARVRAHVWRFILQSKGGRSW